MFIRKLLTVGTGLAVALSATACDPADVTSVNRDPNAPVDAPAPAVFTNGVRLAGIRWFGQINNRQLSLTAQHLAEVQYPETDQYKRLAAGFTNTTFDQTYYAELSDFQTVVKAGMAEKAATVYGPALVMRTWLYGQLTDLWGDIPYSQALAAGDSGGTTQPAYDAQKDIYADFFVVLDKAAKDMAASTPSAHDIGSADPIYGGDMRHWQRFANSLRARHALRLSNVDAAKARTEFLAAMAAPGGLFQSNADNAIIDWPGDGVYDNPFSTNFQTRDDHRISDRLMSVLQASGDPRIPVYAQPADKDDLFRGAPNALTADSASVWVDLASRPGVVLYPGATSYGAAGGPGAGFPSFIQTYAEVQFMLAEARERGWFTTGTAAQYYQQGIRASMEQWDVTDAAAITAFLANPNIVYKGGTDGLKQIATQKWVALFTQGPEAWTEYRRTCQPSVIRPGPEAVSPTVPRRLQYSTTERSVNSANVAAAVARQGADAFTTRVYWDVAGNVTCQ